MGPDGTKHNTVVFSAEYGLVWYGTRSDKHEVMIALPRLAKPVGIVHDVRIYWLDSTIIDQPINIPVDKLLTPINYRLQ